jgi:hypothetical protein
MLRAKCTLRLTMKGSLGLLQADRVALCAVMSITISISRCLGIALGLDAAAWRIYLYYVFTDFITWLDDWQIYWLVEWSGSKPIYGYTAALILLVIHTSVHPHTRSEGNKRQWLLIFQNVLTWRWWHKIKNLARVHQREARQMHCFRAN